MKSIHRWIQEYSEDDDRTFYGLIKAIQEDAYNQGIEDAHNVVTQTAGQWNSDYTDQKRRILNLKVKTNEIKSTSD